MGDCDSGGSMRATFKWLTLSALVLAAGQAQAQARSARAQVDGGPIPTQPDVALAASGVRQAALANNLIWEHYKQDWSVDWEYNLLDKTNIYRPWGYQPGHHTEWAKLLLQLDAHLPADWHLPRAEELFEAAVSRSWDKVNGGLHYGFAPDDSVCDGDKYHWVQAESFAATALLAVRTGKASYWAWYDKIWDYSWKHFVDHEHGAWYRILTPENQKISNEKSPAGKVDYHTMGACYEVLNVLKGAA